MKVRDLKKRKTVISFISNKEGEKIQREICDIRGDIKKINKSINPYAESERTEKILKVKECGMFINVTKDNHLIIGRSFNSEIIDMVEFKIKQYKSVDDFECVGPEMFAKYFVLSQNIGDDRLENLITEFFVEKTSKVFIEGLRYAWIFSRVGTEYVLKFSRVMLDLSIEDCGPYLEMEKVRSYHCGDELYNKAMDQKTKNKPKLKKNAFNDTVGTLYVDKQDLKEVNLRKTRGFKNKKISEINAE